MVPPDLADLRAALEQVELEFADTSEERHVERLTVTTAIVSEALHRIGCVAMLVGGGAIEFYAPEAYLTQDVDLVVEGPPGTPIRERLSTIFELLGFTKLSGRHWERGGMLVEVPGHTIEDPYIRVAVGAYQLNVVRLEVVLVGRIVEFDQTGHTGHAAQAILLLRAVGDTLNPELFTRLLQREQVESAYVALSTLAASGINITDAILRDTHDRLHSRGRYATGYIQEGSDFQEESSEDNPSHS